MTQVSNGSSDMASHHNNTLEDVTAKIFAGKLNPTLSDITNYINSGGKVINGPPRV
jgi:hypothetical protein